MRLRAILVFCLPLLAGCTFSDSLRHDDIRSVWAPSEMAPAQAEVFFATDREPQGATYGLHWGTSLHCGKAEFAVPGALSPDGASEPPLEKADCGDPRQWTGFAAQISADARAHACNQVLLIVPGYNTTFRSALLRAGQVVMDTQWRCAAMVLSWSSEGKFDRYAADIERSGYSVPLLIGLIRELNEAGLEVEIFSQSMGGRITLSAMAALCGGGGLIADQLILAAPDVSAEHDNDDFGNFLNQVAPCVKRVTIYASDNDVALIASENIHGGIPRAGRVPDKDRQYVRAGGNIDVVDASLAPGDSMNHGYFLLSYETLNDVMWVLAGAPIQARTAKGILSCSAPEVSACAAGENLYVLNVAPDRRPDFASLLLRQVWPVLLPIQ